MWEHVKHLKDVVRRSASNPSTISCDAALASIAFVHYQCRPKGSAVWLCTKGRELSAVGGPLIRTFTTKVVTAIGPRRPANRPPSARPPAPHAPRNPNVGGHARCQCLSPLKISVFPLFLPWGLCLVCIFPWCFFGNAPRSSLKERWPGGVPAKSRCDAAFAGNKRLRSPPRP